jgi:hypothetical protein
LGIALFKKSYVILPPTVVRLAKVKFVYFKARTQIGTKNT